MKVWILKDNLPYRTHFLTFKKPGYHKEGENNHVPEADVPDFFITRKGDYSFAPVNESCKIRKRHAPKDFHEGECRAYELIDLREFEALHEKIARLETENNLLRASLKEPLIYSMS